MKMKPMGNTINQRIAAYRKRAGYTQQDIADALNMKLSTYSQKERCSDVTCDFALKIARYLDIDIRYLLFGDDKYSNNGFIDPDFKIEPIETPNVEIPDVKIPKTTIDGKTLYYLSVQQISVIKMLTFFPKKYREKAINYINIIYKFIIESKAKRNS